MNNKKTIFITVSRAIIARNLLFNDFAKLLRNQYKIVLLVSEFEDKEFREKFSDFIIEPLYNQKRSGFKQRLDVFLVSLGKAMIYNPTIELRSRYGLKRRDKVRFKFLRLFFQKYIIKPFFGYSFFRSLLRWFDSVIFSCNQYDGLIKKYDPELIFATSISDPDDIAVIRNAKKFKIKTVGMVKSWDNASKFIFREQTDYILVWSEYMKEEVIKFQDFKKERAIIVGVPQFDYYKNIAIPAKEDFFKKYNLDINKKIIFFGSEGPVSDNDPYIVRYLKEEIISGALDGYQVLVRPHFSYAGDEQRFLDLADNKNIFVDLDYKTSNFKDGIELSLNNIVNLMATIRYSDINITSASTLALDIIANSKYPLLYNFDEDKNLKLGDSVKRLYLSLWMQEILKIPLYNLINSEEALLEKIKELEKNPDLKKEEREIISNRFCFKIDGKSGERIFEFINNLLV